jgi:hypothetical protein
MKSREQFKKFEKKIWSCIETKGTKVDYSPMLKYSKEILKMAEIIIETGDKEMIEDISNIIIPLFLTDNKEFKKEAICIYKKNIENPAVNYNLNILLSLF